MYNFRNLSVIGYSNGFTLWHYATDDDLSSITPNYFDDGADMIRKGDRIIVSGPEFSVDAVCVSHRHASEGKPMVATRIFNCVQFDNTVEQEAPPSLADLKAIMKSPEYWRDQDPDTVAAVRNAFRALYPDEEKS